MKVGNARKWYDRACCLPHVDEGYKPPTPEEIKELQKLMEWTQVEMAKLIGVSFSEKSGSSTIRKWCSPISSNEHRAIPYSAWRLLLFYSGLPANKNKGSAILEKTQNFANAAKIKNTIRND